MSEAKTAKAAVELTKNEDGTWLTVDFGGRKATVSLNNASRGPMITSVLTEWAESHFLPTPMGTAARRAMTLVSECLIAGTVTILLLGAIAGALWLVYTHAGAMAEGFGAAGRWPSRWRRAVLPNHSPAPPQDDLWEAVQVNTASRPDAERSTAEWTANTAIRSRQE